MFEYILCSYLSPFLFSITYYEALKKIIPAQLFILQIQGEDMIFLLLIIIIDSEKASYIIFELYQHIHF